MAKNMIRKSLAIASATSLAVLGLSTPSFGAQADTSKVSLAATDGTATNVVAYDGATFSLTSNEAVPIVGGALSWTVEGGALEVLPFKYGVAAATTGDNGAAYELAAADDTWERDADGVVTVTVANADIDVSAGAVAVGSVVYVKAASLPAAQAADNVAAGYYVVTAVDAVNDTFSFEDGGEVVAARATATVAQGSIAAGSTGLAIWTSVTYDATDDILVVDSGVANAAADEVLVLHSTVATSTSVDVTAWVDDNNDRDIDATEYVSPAKTVQFLEAADISISTIEWDAVLGATGAGSVSADVTFSPTINWDQSEALSATLRNVAGDFAGNATVAEAAGVVTFSDAPDVNNPAVLGAGYVTLTISTATAAEEVAVRRIKVADKDVASVAVAFNTGSNVAQSVDNGDVTVREETSSLTATITVLDSDEEPVSGAVVTVEEATANGTSLDADAVVKVNGELVDVDDNTFDNVTLTTDANGEATLTITSTDGTATDVLDLKVSSENIATDGTTASSDITLTWSAASYTVVRTNVLESGADDQETSFWLGEGNSMSFGFAAFDQWGVAPKAGELRVKAEIDQNDADGDALDTVFKYSTFTSAGTAVLTISDGAAGAETDITAQLDLQAYSDDNAGWVAANDNAANITTGADAVTGEDLTITTGEEDTTVVAFDDFGDGLQGGDGVASDEVADVTIDELEALWNYAGDADPNLNTADYFIGISGDVTLEQDGAAYARGYVTISGSSDLLFVNTNGQDAAANFQYAFGSLSLVADANGEFDFTVFSNKTGEYTITVTSGGTSETVDVEFRAAAKTEGTELTFTVTNAEPGKTMSVVGTLTDDYGNPVDTSGNGQLDITYDAPGFVVGDLPTETDETGTFKFFVLLGANDTISGDITVLYDEDDDADFTDATTLSFAHDLAPAAPAADTKVNAGSFKGYVAVYAKGYEGKRLSAKIGNDWVVVESLASNFERIVDFTGAGYTISVRIYIDRVLVDTIVVTTK